MNPSVTERRIRWASLLVGAGLLVQLTSLLIVHPLAFVVVAVYVVLWLIFDLQSFGWQSAATVATWVMTLFIQRAEHRDTQAIHAKLDELLRVAGEADSDLAMLDQQEPEEIAAHRDNASR